MNRNCETYQGDALTEALEDGHHVTALLHGDHAGVVLLVDPDQERLGVVVPTNMEIHKHACVM